MKQRFTDAFQKRCFEKFRKIDSRTPVLESLLYKIARLTTCNLIKSRLQHRSFSVNIAKLLRIAFL